MTNYKCTECGSINPIPDDFGDYKKVRRFCGCLIGKSLTIHVRQG